MPDPRAEGEHRVGREGVHAFEALVGVLGAHRLPREVVLVGVAGDRATGQPELLGVVVGHEEERVGAVGQDGVLGVVLDTRASSAHRPGWVQGPVRVEHPDLAGVPVLRPDHDQPAAAGRADIQLEALVRLVEHDHVLGVRRPDRVPPDLEGAVGLVVHRVEEVRRVGTPRAAVVAAGHRVGQVLAAVEVAEAELVDLVAGPVHRVGEQALVRADHRQTELEVAGIVGQEVGIEQQLACTGLFRQVEITQQLCVLPSRREERVVVTTLMSPTD